MSTLPLFHWLSSTASQGSNSFIFSRNVNTSTFPLAFKHVILGFEFFHLQQKCQHFHFSIGFQARHLRVRILSSSVEMSTLPLFHWLSSTASQGSNSFIFNRNVNTHFSIGFQARHLRVRILSSSVEMSTLPLFHWLSSTAARGSNSFIFNRNFNTHFSIGFQARHLRVRILSSSVEMSTLPLFHWPSSTSSWGLNSFIFNRNVNTSTFPLAFKHGISGFEFFHLQ